MGAHLQDLGLQPGDRIAILAKNTAHWLLSDFAIWLAGCVSVPLFPTLAPGTIRQILEHSESRLLFVGKLDGWDHMKSGVPADLPCISHPLAPPDAQANYSRWDDIVASTAPLLGEPVRPGEELASIIYTSGTTGAPKGVMHSFEAFAWAVQSGLKRIPLNGSTRGVTRRAVAVDQQGAGSPRADGLPGGDDRGVDSGQRADHADAEGQAQSHRGRVRRPRGNDGNAA